MPSNKSKTYLLLTVFMSGLTTLGVELSASRLLDPFFGNSMVIWATIIGLMLLYLTIGYFIGGRWADYDPRPTTLYQITAVASILVGIIPFIASPVLRWSVAGFASYDLAILASSFVGVLILFSLPITLLGTVSPFAIRLALQDVDVKQGGQIAGSIYALSTLGSLVGTFLPVLFLIPTFGTRLTFFIFAAILLTVSIIGLLLERAKQGFLFAGVLLLLNVIQANIVINANEDNNSAIFNFSVTLTFDMFGNQPIKDRPGLLFETESSYNYIQVVEQGDDQLGMWRMLRLNEGQGVHSVYNPTYPDFPLTDGVWDYFLIAPYFNPPPYQPSDLKRVLVIGSAAGTISKAITGIYGDIPIDGVEIDPEIVAAGRDWFDMNEPNLTVYVQDGRYFLSQTDHTYDLIIVDAYRPPYIPFHLTTQEFFQLIDDHLTADGVVAINAGRSVTDYSLIEALGSTMATIFSDIYVIDVPDYGSPLGNSLVVATKQDTVLENFLPNVQELADPKLRKVAARALGAQIWALEPTGPIFTDDKAPVEQVIHGLIVRYLTGG